ncbi:MAG TPA: aminotransferase class IV, partial [Kiloniellales bacterium]|nr:aminotransferase class IV [Kiloniellales bacterium]
RDAGHAILNGITRLSLLKLIARKGYRFEERPFSLEEARTAEEAFLTSSTNFVLPVTRIDGNPVGDGRVGPLTLALREHYMDYMRSLKREPA